MYGKNEHKKAKKWKIYNVSIESVCKKDSIGNYEILKHI